MLRDRSHPVVGWRPGLLLLLVALLGATPAPVAAEEGPVVAELGWEPEVLGSAQAARIPFRSTPIEGVQVPQGLTNPRYARIRMADTKGLAVALDANPTSPRLWVDANGDGHLADEKRIWMRKTGTMWSRVQRILVKYEGEERTRPVELLFRYMPQSGSDYVQVYAQAHRRGQVVLGGRLRLVALTDGRCDLRFDNPDVDALYVDIDGDGIIGGRNNPYERIKLGEPFRVGDEGWVATVPLASGRVIEFRPSKTVPAAAPRTWPRRGTRKAGMKRTPPSTPLADLAQRFEEERDKDYSTRYRTVGQIGLVGTDDALALLRRIAADSKEDANIRSQAIRAMGNPAYLDKAGAMVLKMATSGENTQRYAAIQALFEMGHPKRMAVYRETLELSDTQQSSAISGAAMYLGYEGTEEARALLAKALRTHSLPMARYYAYSNGLRNMAEGPRIDDMLVAVDVNYVTLQSHALEDLHLLGHERAPQVAREMSKITPVNSMVGKVVARVLGSHGAPDSVKALLAMLDGENIPADVAQEAVKQLRFLRAPDSVAVIVDSLKSKSPIVRKTSAEVLGMLGEEAITKALLKRAKREKDAAVLAALCEALGLHENPAARDVLLKYAKKKDPQVRGPAVRALARLGFEDRKIQKFFVGLLGSSRWEDRVLAIDAAAASKSARFLSSIVKNLEHKAWQVRLAAVEALQKLRDKEGIPALIKRLAREELKRVRDAIAQALFQLTGQNLYDDASVWERWWKENGKTFEVPALPPEAIDSDIAGTGAGFYGIPVETERVVFVIDQSGSMSAASQSGEYEGETKNRLDIAIQEVLRAVDQLPKSARANVILFHTTIHPWEERLVKLSSGNRNKLRNHLKGKRPTGGTNLYDGIEAALLMEGVDTVFVLSDGAPGAGKYTQPRDILRGLRSLNQVRRIAIHCVSIGMDSDLMRDIARQNGGKYVTR